MYQDFFAFHAGLQPTYYRKAKAGEYPANTIKSKTADIIIAQECENIAGFLHVLEDKSPPYDSVVPHNFAVIMDLFVLPLYRNKGVGATLINAAKKWIRKRNLNHLEINVLAENENAIRLYANEGFQPVSHTLKCPIIKETEAQP